MSKTPSPTFNEDYEAIEAAVMETARGRWFLAEYLRRHQAIETRVLLEAIRKLENALGAGGRPSRDIITAMERTARRLADMGREPFAAALPEAVMRMAEEAAGIAARMEELERNGTVDEDLTTILSGQQHLMARKLEAVAGCLKEIAVLCGEETPQETDEPEIDPEQARWFAADPELFETDSAATEEASEEEKAEATADESPARETDFVTVPFDPENMTAAEVIPPSNAECEASPAAEGRTGHLSIIIEPGRPTQRHEEIRTSDEEGEEEDRPRIIITRKRSSNEVDIPMAGDEEETGEAETTADREPEKSEA